MVGCGDLDLPASDAIEAIGFWPNGFCRAGLPRALRPDVDGLSQHEEESTRLARRLSTGSRFRPLARAKFAGADAGGLARCRYGNSPGPSS